ncbi:MAG: hypothetical protein J6A90_08870 [Clostridia bacterium]|nr:hypothetical protein [Clostridia bacterium]
MKKHKKIILIASIIVVLVALLAVFIPIFMLFLDVISGLGIIGINKLGNILFPNLSGY